MHRYKLSIFFIFIFFCTHVHIDWRDIYLYLTIHTYKQSYEIYSARNKFSGVYRLPRGMPGFQSESPSRHTKLPKIRLYAACSPDACFPLAVCEWRESNGSLSILSFVEGQNYLGIRRLSWRSFYPRHLSSRYLPAASVTRQVRSALRVFSNPFNFAIFISFFWLFLVELFFGSFVDFLKHLSSVFWLSSLNSVF